jgi:hypothetical protein
MYESCFVNADQSLIELLVVVMAIVMLGLVARWTGRPAARHYRAQLYRAADERADLQARARPGTDRALVP